MQQEIKVDKTTPLENLSAEVARALRTDLEFSSKITYLRISVTIIGKNLLFSPTFVTISMMLVNENEAVNFGRNLLSA